MVHPLRPAHDPRSVSSTHRQQRTVHLDRPRPHRRQPPTATHHLTPKRGPNESLKDLFRTHRGLLSELARRAAEWKLNSLTAQPPQTQEPRAGRALQPGPRPSTTHPLAPPLVRATAGKTVTASNTDGPADPAKPNLRHARVVHTFWPLTQKTRRHGTRAAILARSCLWRRAVLRLPGWIWFGVAR